MFDVAIIGTGPAGISAALTLKAQNKNFILFGSSNLSEKIRTAKEIRNYPGLVSVSGDEMFKSFKAQLDNMDIKIEDKIVNGVYKMKDHFAILCGNDEYDAKAVIVSTGVNTIKPAIGEIEYLGRGVSYCATCDGFLYKGKTIFIECTSKDYEHEIKYLSSIVKKAYLLPLYKNPEIEDLSNVEIVKKKLERLDGDKVLRKVIFSDLEIEVDGAFMLKDAILPDVLISGIKTDNGHIVVDRNMKTNYDGCFAAGDCTGRPYQYAKAVGEGNVAAHSAIEYLSKL